MKLGQVLDYLGRRETLENYLGLSDGIMVAMYRAKMELVVAITEEVGVGNRYHDILNADMDSELGPKTAAALQALKESTAS